MRMAAGKPFPDSDATGTDAARIALLRALHLQKQTRRAVRMRNSEAAALLARSAVDACIIGLNCLYREGAVRELDGAENRGVRRVLAYLPGTGLVPQDLVDAAAGSLGKKGHDLRLGNIAAELKATYQVDIGVSLYQRHYVPLSHFYAHSSESALTRQVYGRLTRRRTAPAWTHRSPVRVADACVGYLAAHLALQTGRPDAVMLSRYGDAHLDRAVTPAAALALKGFVRLIPWRQVPAGLREARALRRYMRASAATVPRSEAEERVRAFYAKMLGLVDLGMPADAMHSAVDYFVAGTVSSWTGPAAEPDADT